MLSFAKQEFQAHQLDSVYAESMENYPEVIHHPDNLGLMAEHTRNGIYNITFYIGGVTTKRGTADSPLSAKVALSNIYKQHLESVLSHILQVGTGW